MVIHIDYFRLRQDDCLHFVIKPFLRFFELDEIRPENVDFDGAVVFDKEIRKMMNYLQIFFIHITMEDLQERNDFVTQEMFKRWPELKNSQMRTFQNGFGEPDKYLKNQKEEKSELEPKPINMD